MKTKRIEHLFNYVGPRHHHSGKLVKNYCKIFLIKTKGTPKPANEIKYIGFWKPGSKIKIFSRTRMIMNKYLKEFKE